MIATTRSASISPESMRVDRPLASETWAMGTLRTTIGSGMWLPPAQLRAEVRRRRSDDRARSPRGTGDDRVEAGDHPYLARCLHEPTDGLDLRTHRAGPELAFREVATHLGDIDLPDRLGSGCSEAEYGVLHVRGDHQPVDLDRPGQQRGTEVLV